MAHVFLSSRYVHTQFLRYLYAEVHARPEKMTQLAMDDEVSIRPRDAAHGACDVGHRIALFSIGHYFHV